MFDDDTDERFDDDELRDLYEESTDSITPEEVFTMVTLNKIRKVTVKVELRDESDDVVSLPDTIEGILNYIKEKTDDEENNQLTEQILPLISQSVVSGLGRMLGIRQTALMLAHDITKYGIINMMCVSLLLLKFVQNNNLKIYTYEEPVSDEEIEEIERKSRASGAAMIGMMTGMDPREILEQLVEEGELTQEDLEDILAGRKRK
jgi:hypothetical protein